MKPQEAELVTEISKLQCTVSELKAGFTAALLELGQIQHGDTYLREELEESRRSCRKKAARLEALVESLKEELGVMQRQVLQLYAGRQRPQQDGKSSAPKPRDTDPEPAGGRSQRDRPSAPAATLPRGKLLLHCFLQGLKAGLSEGTDARHQVAMQLLHSEWEYVSMLNQLYDKYKTPPAHRTTAAAAEPYRTYATLVERLLQRHLLFRNTLQERLSAEHWKSLVGDILVQLIGQNDTAFCDAYLGYTTTLASFLSLELSRPNHGEKSHAGQSGQTEREEMRALSLLLAPVSRLHGYLSHIQNLLQWTGKEHPDCSLLLGSERALRGVLSRCHTILEEEVRWEEGEGQRDEQQTASLTNGVDGHAMRLECWSCSPVRRKACGGEQAAPGQPGRDCGHARRSLLTPEAPGWGENSDSGQGTFSHPTGRGTSEPPASRGHLSPEDCETDPDDTSAFDYSSVTSCSPDGTLRRQVDSNSGEGEEEEEDEEEDDEEEEDSQVPVLLKPSYSQKQQQQQQQASTEAPRERTVCLRWQIPRLTPHPPLRHPARQRVDGPTPCLIGSYGKRLLNVRTGSPPLHPKSAFRPIWDDPSKQADSTPEKESRAGFIPIQASVRQNFQNFNRDKLRPGPAQQHGGPAAAAASGGLWDESEDSEGPCSTV